MINTDDNNSPEMENDIYYNIEPDNPELENDRDDGADSPDTGSKNDKPRRRNPCMLLFKMFFAPVEGWKAIKRAKFTASEFGWRCFYPLIAVCALSTLLDPIYDHDATIPKSISNAIIMFMTYIITNFGTQILCNISFFSALKRQINTDFGKIYVMACIASLAVAMALEHFFPWIAQMIAFMPIYTIYLIMKGLKFLRTPTESTGRYTVFLACCIVGLPFLLKYLFSVFIAI